MQDGRDPNSVWKFTTTFLAGVVISLITMYFANQKNVVTQDYLNQELLVQQRQLDDQSRTINELRISVVSLEIQTGRIAEHLGVAKQ